MIINRICQFSVVVKDKPPSLPPLGPVDWVWEVPVWGHEQVTTFWYLSAGFVELYRGGGMVFLQSETIRAFALIENVWSEFPALHVSHDVTWDVVTVSWCVRHCQLFRSPRRGEERGQAGPAACPASLADWLDPHSYNWTFPLSHGHTASHHQSQWKVVIQRTGLGSQLLTGHTCPADISQPEKSLWQTDTNWLHPHGNQTLPALCNYQSQNCNSPTIIRLCYSGNMRAESVIEVIIINPLMSRVIYHKLSLKEILSPR